MDSFSWLPQICSCKVHGSKSQYGQSIIIMEITLLSKIMFGSNQLDQIYGNKLVASDTDVHGGTTFTHFKYTIEVKCIWYNSWHPWIHRATLYKVTASIQLFLKDWFVKYLHVQCISPVFSLCAPSRVNSTTVFNKYTIWPFCSTHICSTRILRQRKKWWVYLSGFKYFFFLKMILPCT